MVEKFMTEVRDFAIRNVEIDAIILVGSWARGTNGETSDIDLCIITPNKKRFIDNCEFVNMFGKTQKIQTEYYGACTSLRVWYEDGLEVEFGMVKPSWIGCPLDEGTRKVLSDGYKVIVDKKGYFENLKI